MKNNHFFYLSIRFTRIQGTIYKCNNYENIDNTFNNATNNNFNINSKICVIVVRISIFPFCNILFKIDLTTKAKG